MEKLSTGGAWENSDSVSMVRCTDHMCPVQVHWHVKTNYRDKWRVKVTVSSYRYGHNYSDWNLVVQHPGLKQPFRTYSFNSTRLTTMGNMGNSSKLFGSSSSLTSSLIEKQQLQLFLSLLFKHFWTLLHFMRSGSHAVPPSFSAPRQFPTYKNCSPGHPIFHKILACGMRNPPC